MRMPMTQLATLLSLFASAVPALAQDDDVFVPPLDARLAIVAPDGRMRSLPVVEESLRVTIDGQHATTRLRQVFHNEESRVVEGSYALFAGPGARVSGFSYWNGEEKIVGEVFERTAAESIYGRVTSRRRDPGLLVQRGEGSFQFRVFPIQPDEDKRVEVAYAQWLPRRGRSIEYRAPVSDARASIEVVIQSSQQIENVRSRSHALRVEQLQGGVRIRARADGRPRELVLQYELAGPDFEPTLAIHRDPGQDGYFVLSLAAPEQRERATAAKDVTLVLDRSGSMAGEPLEQARSAAAGIVRRLPAQDRVNVIAFDDDVDPLFERPQPVSEETRREALDFVAGISNGGGTNIAFALEAALQHQHDDGERPRVVLFVTDGRSDAASALRVAGQDERDVRVFTVGVGPEVDKPLLSRLAAEKRGRFTFVASEATLESSLHDVYSQIAEPLLVDVTLTAEGADLRRVYPRSLPDLFARDELRVHGRLRGEGRVRLTLEGSRGGRRVQKEIWVDLDARTTRPWVGRLWAEARVDDLLEQIALEGPRPELQEEVIDLSLAYSFVTPFTAFLAIPEREITADVRGDVERARERKAEVLERLTDARALAGDASDLLPSPGPMGDAPGRPDDLVMELDAAGDAEGWDEPPTVGTSPERAGCASCSIGGRSSPPSVAWLALLCAVALRRRGRSRSRPDFERAD